MFPPCTPEDRVDPKHLNHGVVSRGERGIEEKPALVSATGLTTSTRELCSSSHMGFAPTCFELRSTRAALDSGPCHDVQGCPLVRQAVRTQDRDITFNRSRMYRSDSGGGLWLLDSTTGNTWTHGCPPSQTEHPKGQIVSKPTADCEWFEKSRQCCAGAGPASLGGGQVAGGRKSHA